MIFADFTCAQTCQRKENSTSATLKGHSSLASRKIENQLFSSRLLSLLLSFWANRIINLSKWRSLVQSIDLPGWQTRKHTHRHFAVVLANWTVLQQKQQISGALGSLWRVERSCTSFAVLEESARSGDHCPERCMSCSTAVVKALSHKYIITF